MSYITTKNQFIEVNKQQIAYRILNEPAAGKPLVMLTHLAATMDNWDPKLIDLLAQSRTIIVVDLPGVGESQGKVATSIEAMAKQALDFIESLGYEKIDLLGLSMGGMIAQELVRLKSELKIVLDNVLGKISAVETMMRLHFENTKFYQVKKRALNEFADGLEMKVNCPDLHVYVE